eukprot:1339100-Amorphochlora_amoeboformis.AAC.1
MSTKSTEKIRRKLFMTPLIVKMSHRRRHICRLHGFSNCASEPAIFVGFSLSKNSAIVWLPSLDQNERKEGWGWARECQNLLIRHRKGCAVPRKIKESLSGERNVTFYECHARRIKVSFITASQATRGL